MYCLIFIICALIGFYARGRLIGSVSMQKPEKRWSSDGRSYSYIAAYIPATEGITDDSIRGFRNEFTTAIKEASIEINENARPFIDAYSLESTAEVTKDRNARSPAKVNITAVGGDYFYFHPFTLLSGSYISEDLQDDNMDDKVVLDERTAWLLYGGADVAGKTVLIEGKRFFIAGVVRPDNGKASKKTYGNKSRMYMTYAAYSKLRGEENLPNGGDDLEPGGGLHENVTSAITAYEIVYPDPITNFAYNQVKKEFGIEENNSDDEEETVGVEVVNFSTRFKYLKMWNIIKEYGTRSSKTNGIIYPFWENECRRIEDFAVIWQLAATIFAAAAAVTLFPDIKRLYVTVVSGVQKLIHSRSGKYRQ